MGARLVRLERTGLPSWSWDMASWSWPMKKISLGGVLLAVAAHAWACFVSGAQAASIPYPDPGTMNPVTYTFTATATGNVTAYFYGFQGAIYTDSIGMIDGATTNPYGLPNQSSSVGESFNLGNVTAGDVLTFYLNVVTGGANNLQNYTLYSNPALNPYVPPVTPPGGVNYKGDNQVYAAAFSGDLALSLPAGVFLAFEDGTGYNYLAEEVVLTNVSFTATPLPAALPLFATGIGGLGLFGSRRKRKAQSVAA